MANRDCRKLEGETRGVWERYYSAICKLPERLKKPVPFVVEALPLFRQNRGKAILDLGCGTGRHCIYFAENGFDVVGVDISRSALRLAKAWSQTERIVSVSLVRASMANLPFVSQFFQAVVSISVIHHAVKEDIEKTISEAHRVLQDSGIFLANLLSVEDYRYGLGQKVEEQTFRVTEELEEECFEEVHHFCTRGEASKFVSIFRNIDVEPIHGGKENRLHCYWKVTATK